MGDVLSWPADKVPVPSPLSSLWEVSSPHTPLAFWALEEEAHRTAREVARSWDII